MKNVVKEVKSQTRKNISGSLELHSKLHSYGNIDDSYSSLIMDIIEFAEAHGMTKSSLEQWRKERRK